MGERELLWIHEGRLVVVIETPHVASGASRTSVNLAGPPRAVVEHGWDAGEALAIE